MLPNNFQLFFVVGSILWVGGWGFLMFRYPKFFAGINARFELTIFASSKFVSLTRWMGIVGMTLACLAALGEVIVASLHT